MNNVYIVVRRNPDLTDYMVEIMGVFADKEQAEQRQRDIWAEYEFSTHIESFMLLDRIVGPYETKGSDTMPHPHKNRPRKGRRKIGSKKRKAQSNNRKK